MKRIYSIVMLMALTASVAVAQQRAPEPCVYAKAKGCLSGEWVREVAVPANEDPILPVCPLLKINVNLTDDSAILEPVINEEGYTLSLFVDGCKMDIPCVLQRGRADYTIEVTVIAQREGYGTFYDYLREIVIPATGHFLPDVDGDGAASIADVAKLIDHILNPQGVPVEWLKADCDGDGSVTITDVSALIDYLIHGTW